MQDEPNEQSDYLEQPHETCHPPDLSRALEETATSNGWRVESREDGAASFSQFYALADDERTWSLFVRADGESADVEVYRDAPKVVAHGEGRRLEPDAEGSFDITEVAPLELGGTIWEELELPALR